MIVKAIYEPTGNQCYINLDYVVDVLPQADGRLFAYTIDSERGAYVISQKDLEAWITSKQ